MSSAVAVVATISAFPSHEPAVEQALRAAVLAVRGEPGCEQYALHRDERDSARFVMIERWSSAQALAQHMQAAAFRALAQQLDGRAALDVVKLAPLA